jgi:hypothetical protein
MVRNIGAQIGLLAFLLAVLAGLHAGNSPTVIMSRALVALAIGAVLGQLAGWSAKLVLRDYLQKRKLQIDRRHFEAVRAMTGVASDQPPDTPVTPPEVAKA